MYLKSLELIGFKSFAKKTELSFSTSITAIVGPNGSGKSNTAEAFRFVLGEQSIKSMRGKRGEDLIFGGSTTVPRAGRASVKVVFDNRARLLNVDFDEVVVERAVMRDGTNEYRINGSLVRLKDVLELLSGANIGSTGHHIISQGEADRVLSASPKERRYMIEDALGLRVYQYKKDESLRKLEKTEENRAQVEGLKKENQPHLRFLEKQVEKLQKAAELRTKLADVYQEYLRREELYLTYQDEVLAGEREGPERELAELSRQLAEVKETIAIVHKDDQESGELISIDSRLSEARAKKDELTRALGRLEGQIAFEEARMRDAEARRARGGEVTLPRGDLVRFAEEVHDAAAAIEAALPDPERVRVLLGDLRTSVSAFAETFRAAPEAAPEEMIAALAQVREQKTRLEQELNAVQQAAGALEGRYRELSREIEAQKDESREAERRMFELIARQNEVRAVLATLTGRVTALDREREEFRRELAEAGALMGRAILGYKEFSIRDEDGEDLSVEAILDESRSVQEERRRSLEKMKIRLEEMGGGSADEIMKEYQEVKERDEFLAREIADLEQSAASLRTLIADLDRELDQKFKDGISKISEQFGNFFTIMFGGGSAALAVVAERPRRRIADALALGADAQSAEEEEESEEGIDIAVSLPNKRVKGLSMLSGGERALTSIALIFAMSQVNPPPFIILDETDAALDEANSRRYGDMIETLAQKSQLILITHNRETMSRAGVLYGVTMGSDGVSKLLSVKFDEAMAVAK